jgi:hypothetical protein
MMGLMFWRSATANIRIDKMPRKITTPIERIDQLIASYEDLDRQAHDLLDAAVAELRLECPNIPVGVLKACSFTRKAGNTLDVPAALKLLRKRFEK